MGMCMFILGSLYILCWVSLIAGDGYRVQQWGGKWDGTVGVANSCNWRCCSRLCWLRLLPHRRGRMGKSSVATFLLF